MNDGSGKELRRRRHGPAGKHAAGTATRDPQRRRRGIALVDQKLATGDRVFPGVGLAQLASRHPPGIAVDAAAAHVGHCQHATLLQPRDIAGAKAGGFAVAVRPVAQQQRRVGAVQLQPLAMQDGHGHHHAVVAANQHVAHDHLRQTGRGGGFEPRHWPRAVALQQITASGLGPTGQRDDEIGMRVGRIAGNAGGARERQRNRAPCAVTGRISAKANRRALSHLDQQPATPQHEAFEQPVGGRHRDDPGSAQLRPTQIEFHDPKARRLDLGAVVQVVALQLHLDQVVVEAGDPAPRHGGAAREVLHAGNQNRPFRLRGVVGCGDHPGAAGSEQQPAVVQALKAEVAVDGGAEQRTRLLWCIAEPEHVDRGVQVGLAGRVLRSQLAQLVVGDRSAVRQPGHAALRHARNRGADMLTGAHVQHIQGRVLRAAGRQAVSEIAPVPGRNEVVDRMRHAGALRLHIRVDQQLFDAVEAVAHHQLHLAVLAPAQQIEQLAAGAACDAEAAVAQALVEFGQPLLEPGPALDPVQHAARPGALRGDPRLRLRIGQVLHVAVGIVHGDAVPGVDLVAHGRHRRRCLRQGGRYRQRKNQGRANAAPAIACQIHSPLIGGRLLCPSARWPRHR